MNVMKQMTRLQQKTAVVTKFTCICGKCLVLTQVSSFAVMN